MEQQNLGKRYRYLFSLIDRDPTEFARLLGDLGEPFARSAIFNNEDDVLVVARKLRDLFVARSTSPEGLHQISSAFTRRYVPRDMKRIIEAEKPFLMALIEKTRAISAEIKSEHSLAKAACNDLLRALAGAVES
jgi:hypothetical protein